MFSRYTEHVSERVVAVYFPSLPLDVVLLGDELTTVSREGGPKAVVQEVQRESLVVDVSAEARSKGIREHMTEVAARAMCAQLTVYDRDLSRELLHLERLADVLMAYGPMVEVCPPSFLLVEIRAKAPNEERILLQQMAKQLRSVGYALTIAVADDIDTACIIAQQLSRKRIEEPSADDIRFCSREVRSKTLGSARVVTIRSKITTTDVCCKVVFRGRSAKVLAGLPIEALVWPDHISEPMSQQQVRLYGICEALNALKITTVGALQSLASEELGTRFGIEGRLLWDRAWGQHRRPMRKHVPPPVLEEDTDFDQVIEDVEPILFVLRRLLHRLEIRLHALQRAVRVLSMQFWVEPTEHHQMDLGATRPRFSKYWVQKEVKMARATRSSNILFSVLREQLGGSLPGGVWAVRLGVKQSEVDRGAQLDLFSRSSQKCEDLGALVGRLSVALGEAAVFSPVLVNTHRPEASWQKKAFSVEDALRASERKLPKRQARQEWLRAVPPRPSFLLPCPEPAMYVRERGIVRWRGRILRIRALRGHEQFRTEWWLPKGKELNRDYIQVETEDGILLWMYTTPHGATFIHGIFD